MKLKIILAVLAVSLLFISGLGTTKALTTSSDTEKLIEIKLGALQVLPKTTKAIKTPKLKNPEWLQTQLDAELATQQSSASRSGSKGVITYNVTTRGAIRASLATFKTFANQTLNDSRGWSRLGVSFQEVSSGGSFTLVLSEANQVPSFNPSVCSSYWSCQIGSYVIINQDRWLGATDAWNSASGSLRDYQHMVINHETGHWLGHGHDNSGCSLPTQPAPIMQQQSMDLRGCKFNPWPLTSELWSSRI